ncbi:hypothetical protein NB636_10645 [Oxalobacter aliiformigenes]|uniref:hypothetical protein n=1 Tax=Oxalobacter aliiformigenes TaxID=2946593 RepID=UPI0022AF7F14|nr:hypothetical protein [Oxalobacter aliiformigenes]MCZ4064637.1 hypothetical protein [Oxalobacter aliiformigenes]WAV99116.1 hypothetical protein NB636_10645 [Oxalobacter aliiformigenes]
MKGIRQFGSRVFPILKYLADVSVFENLFWSGACAGNVPDVFSYPAITGALGDDSVDPFVWRFLSPVQRDLPYTIPAAISGKIPLAAFSEELTRCFPVIPEVER